MKRVVMLTAVASAMLAISATPAMAELPNGDTDSDHYSTVYLDESEGPCTSSGCEFTGEAQDFTYTLDTNVGPVIHPCHSATLGYDIDSSGGSITDFDIASVTWTPGQCQTPLFWQREQAICAYSPSGDFQGDIEFWLRDDWATGSQANPALDPAFGQLDGDTAYAGDGIVVDKIDFIDEVLGVNLSPGLYSMTVDGVVQINDDDVTFLADDTGGTCSAFPELDS